MDMEWAKSTLALTRTFLQNYIFGTSNIALTFEESKDIGLQYWKYSMGSKENTLKQYLIYTLHMCVCEFLQ